MEDDFGTELTGKALAKPTAENIAFFLPVNVEEALKLQGNEPFEADIDYYFFLESVVHVNYMSWSLRNNLTDKVFNFRQREFACPEAPAVLNGLELAAVIATIHSKLEDTRKERLAATVACGKTLPRIVRMLNKLDATEIETSIFQFLFMYFSSDKVVKEVSNYYNPRFNTLTCISLARYLCIPVLEIFDFFQTGSKFVKENLVAAVSTTRAEVQAVSEGNSVSFLGIPLTQSQFLAIESTALQNLITDEPGFESTPAGRSNPLKISRADSEPDGEAAPAVLSAADNYREMVKTQKHLTNIESLYVLLKKEEGGEVKLPPPPLNDDVDQDSTDDEPTVPSPLPTQVEGVDVAATRGKVGPGDADGVAEQTQADNELRAYVSDLEYLQDQIALTSVTMKICKLSKVIEDVAELDEDDPQTIERYDNEIYDQFNGRYMQKDQLVQKKESSLRKLRQKERVLKGKIRTRLSNTKAKAGSWFPRLERLTEALTLSTFEKFVVLALIATVIAPNAISSRAPYMGYGGGGGGNNKCKMSVNDLLNSFCGNLEEQIRSRKYFYKTSVLVQEGVLNMLGQDFMADLTDCVVEIDRRMLDFVVGLDTEFSEIVDGSHLYTPNVELEDVILPDDIKSMVIETVSNFDQVKLVQKNLEIDKKITYGRGMALLFYGTSGTGKTMLANAIATKLGRKVLLINFPTLGMNNADLIIKLIFRESKIHNAIIFFDECESLFQSREKGSMNVNMILTELERHDGLSIMATNRPHDLDEAMYRRINLAIEFRKPDHILREKIWKSLQPPKLELASDVDILELALKYELTGGFIKNTWLSALSFAVTRDGMSPIVTHADLKKAAAHQLRGRLTMVDFDRRIIPTRGLDDIVVPASIKSALNDIVNFGKAQSILFGQWGFAKQHGSSKGIGALFHGSPGTGKTMAAEAIGYDLGRPLKVVNCAQLLSKWVGESSKNIQTVFDEAKAVDAVLVFDEAEGLFGSRGDGGDGASRHDTVNVGILLHYMETFPGVVVVITNVREQIDTAFFRRFKFVIDFPRPTAVERKQLWKLLIPVEAPIAADVDYDLLSRKYDMAGGNIKSAVFRAASRAALRPASVDRVICMLDLTKACDEEQDKEQSRITNAMRTAMYN